MNGIRNRVTWFQGCRRFGFCYNEDINRPRSRSRSYHSADVVHEAPGETSIGNSLALNHTNPLNSANLNSSPDISDNTKFYRRMISKVREHHNLPAWNYSIDYEAIKFERQIEPGINWSMQKSIHNSDTLFRLEVLLRELSNSTNGESCKIFPPESDRVEFHHNSIRKLSNLNELPKLPNEWTSENFAQILKQLTSVRYVDPGISSPTGLVSNIVHDLMRINNRWTQKVRNISAYNLCISYFIHVACDLRSARELFFQIRSDNLEPNIQTYNIMLTSIGQQFKLKTRIEHALIFPLNVVEDMKLRGIGANAETWNIILCAVPGLVAKTLIVQEMYKWGVPLSARGFRSVIQAMLDTMGVDEAIKCVEQHHQHTVECLNLIVDALLRQKRIGHAWKYVTKVASYCPNAVRSSTLSVFTSYFAQTSRVDWIIGVMSSMNHLWGVKTDPQIWHDLFKAAVLTRFHPNKASVLRMIYVKMTEQPHYIILPKTNRWIRLASRKFEYYQSKGIVDKTLDLNSAIRLTDKEKRLWNKSSTVFRWNKDPYIYYYDSKSVHARYAKQLGIPISHHNPSLTAYFFTKERILKNKRYSKQSQTFYAKSKEEFQQQLRENEIKERIKIATGPYEKFVQDLKTHKMIDEDP